MNKEMSLEQALEKLEKNAEKIKDKDIGIDESLKLIDESKKLYEYASAIISESESSRRGWGYDQDIFTGFPLALRGFEIILFRR